MHRTRRISLLRNSTSVLGNWKKFKNRPAIVLCQAGGRSHAAIALLKKAGFTEVVVLAGGINAWQQANMPVEK